MNSGNRRKILYITTAFLIVTVFIFILQGSKFLSDKLDTPNVPEGWKIIKPPHEVSCLVEKDGIIWAGGMEGVYRINAKTGELIEGGNNTSDFQYVKALLLDKENNLWIGHEAGLTRYDGRSYKTFTEENGLPDSRINCLLQDTEGNIWAGTYNGAAIYSGEWRSISVQDGLLHNTVNVIYQDKKGGIWLGNYAAPKGGLSYLKDNKWQYFNIENGLPHNNINAILEDETGEIWCGAGFYDHGGLCKLIYSEGKWIINGVMTKKDGLAGAKVRSLFKDNRGIYWIGSEYDGIALLKGTEHVVLKVEDGLPDPEIKVILQDEYDNIWLGTRDGIVRIERNTVEKILMSK